MDGAAEKPRERGRTPNSTGWPTALGVLGLAFAVPGMINDLGGFQVAALFMATAILVAAAITRFAGLRRTGRADVISVVLWSATACCAFLLGSTTERVGSDSAPDPRSSYPAPQPPTVDTSAGPPTGSDSVGPTSSPPPSAAPSSASPGKFLADLEPVNTDYSAGSHTVNERKYNRSLSGSGCVLRDSETASYNLARRYTRFRVVVGLDDRSTAGIERTFTVSVDGKDVESRSVKLGQIETIDISVDGVFRLDLTSSANCPLGEGVGVWADPVLTPL